MNVIALSAASLLTGSSSTPSQPVSLVPMAGIAPSFLQMLEIMTPDLVSQAIAQVPKQAFLHAMLPGDLEVDATALTPSTPVAKAENENSPRPILDASCLAAWFQYSAPVPVPVPVPVISPLSPSSAIQAALQSTPIGSFIVDKRSQQNLPTDSDNLRPSEVFFNVPIDSSGAIKSGLCVAFNYSKDMATDLVAPVLPEPPPFSLVTGLSPEYAQLAGGADAVAQGPSPEAKWTSNLADTVNQWVERSLQVAELTVPAAGQDSLQVRIELNGLEATVHFLTDHVKYREALGAQIENLSDRLAEQGLKLSGSFVGQGGAQNSPNKQSTNTLFSRRYESEPAADKVFSIDPGLRAVRSVHLGRVLDVFA